MKVNGIKFVYRGTDQSAGKLLAHLLEEISVEYTIGEDVADPSGNGITYVNADLGALLRTLDERVITKPKAQADKMAKLAAEERAEREKYTTTTPIPPVHVRYIVQRYVVGMGSSERWEQVKELPFNVGSVDKANELMAGAALRFPTNLHRVTPFWMTDEEFEVQNHRQKLESICDDILRQVVCQCGSYRHHGVGWMPEGSGEGLSVAVDILRKAGL